MTPDVEPSPWYHHFWPWFIVLLLGISVIASLYTVSLAYRLGDIEVAADESAPAEDETRVGESERAPRAPVR
jgi:hypothetical protein